MVAGRRPTASRAPRFSPQALSVPAYLIAAEAGDHTLRWPYINIRPRRLAARGNRCEIAVSVGRDPPLLSCGALYQILQAGFGLKRPPAHSSETEPRWFGLHDLWLYLMLRP